MPTQTELTLQVLGTIGTANPFTIDDPTLEETFWQSSSPPLSEAELTDEADSYEELTMEQHGQIQNRSIQF